MEQYSLIGYYIRLALTLVVLAFLIWGSSKVLRRQARDTSGRSIYVEQAAANTAGATIVMMLIPAVVVGIGIWIIPWS